MTKLRIALIGLGDIAQKAYLPIVTNHPLIEPIFCTRKTAVLKQLTKQYRIHESYSDIDELIRNKPDAAMIHSATKSHFTLASKLLKAGIPVFIDKPLSYTLNETEEILNLASQKQLLIYLGFNRRFAPLINSLTTQKEPIEILWKKNRVNLPEDPRVFIFDDFIHVADSLRFLAPGKIEGLHVFSKSNNNRLESLHIQWNQNNTLVNGSMNRISGITEEYTEYYTKGNKWIVNELTSGFHYQSEKTNSLGFGNWENTLYKRGFVNMIEDWLQALQQTKYDSNRNQDIWETHNLCETICRQIK